MPNQPTDFGPAMTRVAGSGAIDGKALAGDAESCAPCHAAAVAQWKTSAHAFASFDNPIYRASVKGFRKQNGNEKSRFCAGCHDPALLLDGAMDVAIDPADTRSHAGVTCLTCHSIEKTTRDGNGSYTLRTDAVVLPIEGDPASLAAHKRRLALPPLRTAELCASCHRAFLGRATGHDHFFPGADDYGAWLSSVYAGNELDRIDSGNERELAAKECRTCHMPDEEGIKSHRFLGGHTWLAAMRGDADQLARVQRNLRGAASVDLVAIRDAAGHVTDPRVTELSPGQAVDLEVVVTNERVGHRFPGGTLDMHDVWLEVLVSDAQGEVVAAHGVDHKSVDDAHVFHAVIVDREGDPVLARRVEAFATVAYDSTVLPRDSVVIPYELTVPELPSEAMPLTVVVRLLHRSREPELARVACADDEREAYERVTPLAPCVDQPVTEIARQQVTLGGGRMPELSLTEARRLLRHGTAWQHVLVEEIDKARPTLVRVVDDLVAASPTAKILIGSAQHQLALIASRQGRIEEMQTWLGRAQRNVPGHPALAYVRGRALSSVWRHRDAIPWLRVAASGAPSDVRGWTALAVGLGSVGDHVGALAAAQRGMAYASRHPDLLRVQSLALTAWGQPAATRRAAGTSSGGKGTAARNTRAMPSSADVRDGRSAFVTHRRRDDAPRLRSLCADRASSCALERTPAHHHVLAAPAN